MLISFQADSYAPLRILANGQAQGSIIDTQDEQLITALRRAIGSAFAVKNLLDYEHDVEVTAAVLIEKILKCRNVDLFDTLQRFQMDFLTISELRPFLYTFVTVGRGSSSLRRR